MHEVFRLEVAGARGRERAASGVAQHFLDSMFSMFPASRMAEYLFCFYQSRLTTTCGEPPCMNGTEPLSSFLELVQWVLKLQSQAHHLSGHA